MFERRRYHKIKIAKITHDAMNGEIGFSSALKKRVSLLKTNKKQIEDVIAVIEDRLSDSFVQNKVFFIQNTSNCYIVSGGFIEIIYPILKPFNISKNNIRCYVNTICCIFIHVFNV